MYRGLGLDGFNATSFLKRKVIDKENLQENKYLGKSKKSIIPMIIHHFFYILS